MYPTGTPTTLRRLNQRAVVRWLAEVGQGSRASCAKAVGLSQPTTGKIIDELLADGLIEEVAAGDADGGATPAPARMGRPGQLLRLDRSRDRLALIQVGVKNTRVARVPVGLRSEEVWTTRFPTARTAERWEADLRKAVGGRAGDGLLGVAVSVPGVVDEAGGRVLLSPNLHWLESVRLDQVCREMFGRPILLVQEIRALALGQLQADPAAHDFLLVDFGDGVGASAVIGGRLFAGPLALSGELGHTPVAGNRRPCGCGAIGCVETLVSRDGLLQSFRAGVKSRGPHDWAGLVEHVRRQGVRPWLAAALDAAATTMAGALNVLGLRRVIVTGSLTELPPAVVGYLSDAVVRGAMWARFGQVTCAAAPRRRATGLVAAAIDRMLLAADPAAADPPLDIRAVQSQSA